MVNLNPRRLLVRGVNWLGDAVMSTPALARLRERFPEAHIAMLAPRKIAGLWQHHPAVNEVLSFDDREGVFTLGRRLRASGFDLALVLPNSPRSALEIWAARIPRRVGYRRPWRNWFLTDRVEDRAGAVAMHKRSPEQIRKLVASGRGAPAHHASRIPSDAHHIHQYLHLTAALGARPEPLAPSLHVTEGEVAEVRTKFAMTQDAPWLALNPGAEYGPAKRWPADRFAAAAKQVQMRTRCRWLVLGGKGDVEVATRIATELPGSLNLAGRTSLRELCAVLKLSRVLLTNDTGPMHVGAAAGTPVVALFGSTSPELTGPISSSSVRHQILQGEAICAPCFLRECPVDFRCLLGVEVSRAAGAVLAVLEPPVSG